VISQNLALVVKQFFNKENKPSISIPVPWKDPPLHESTIEIEATKETNETKNVPCSTCYQRYCPTRKNPDFYGCNG